MKKSTLFAMSMSALLIVSMAPAFAGTAPVYDADAMIPYGNPADDVEVTEPPVDSSANLSSAQDQAGVGALAANQPSQPMSMSQRLKRIEQQVQGVQSANTNSRVESLQNQVQVLRNQVEQLTHQLEQVQTQQKSLYADLDERMSKSELAAKTFASKAKSAIPKATHTASKKKPSQPDSAEEQRIYQQAYNLIKAKKYSEAVTSLKGMLKKYPSGQFASNAHYWLGELYGLLGNHRQSLTEFESVIKDFPDSSRVADAQLKIGLIYASQSNWNKAKLAFNTVTKDHSGTAPARLAKEQLKQLKQAGH